MNFDGWASVVHVFVVVKKREQLIKLLLRNRVKFVRMTLSTTDGKPQPDG